MLGREKTMPKITDSMTAVTFQRERVSMDYRL
jgi:hypothetical protein